MPLRIAALALLSLALEAGAFAPSAARRADRFDFSRASVSKSSRDGLGSTDRLVLEQLLDDPEFRSYLDQRNMTLTSEELNRLDEKQDDAKTGGSSSRFASQTLRNAAEITEGGRGWAAKIRMGVENLGRYIISKAKADAEVTLSVLATAATRAAANTNRMLSAAAVAAPPLLLPPGVNSTEGGLLDSVVKAAEDTMGSIIGENVTLGEAVTLLQLGALTDTQGDSKRLSSLRGDKRSVAPATPAAQRAAKKIARDIEERVPGAVKAAAAVATAPVGAAAMAVNAAADAADIAYSAKREVEYDDAGLRVNKMLAGFDLRLPIEEINGAIGGERPQELSGGKTIALGGASAPEPSAEKAAAAAAATAAAGRARAVVEVDDIKRDVVTVDATAGAAEVVPTLTETSAEVAEVIEAAPFAPTGDAGDVLEVAEVPAREAPDGVGGSGAAASAPAPPLAAEVEAEAEAAVEVFASAVDESAVAFEVVESSAGVEVVIDNVEAVAEDSREAEDEGPGLALLTVRLTLRALDVLLLLAERGAAGAQKGVVRLSVAAYRAQQSLRAAETAAEVPRAPRGYRWGSWRLLSYVRPAQRPNVVRKKPPRTVPLDRVIGGGSSGGESDAGPRLLGGA